jgi:hypothetical protein
LPLFFFISPSFFPATRFNNFMRWILILPDMPIQS